MIKKKAVITGATGFIGSYLVHELSKYGYDMLLIVKKNTRNIDRISKIPGVNIIECDMSGYKELYSTIKQKHDIFYHLAWDGVSGDNQSSIEIQQNNIKYSIDALFLAKQLGCHSFIGAGSIQEKELLHEMKSEKKLLNKSNTYKIAKLTTHFYCRLIADNSNINFYWPLITNTFGVGEISNRLINYIIIALLKNEEPILSKSDQLYNFIYITDTARAFRLIAEKGVSNREYIIGSDRVVPLKEYIDEIKESINTNCKLGYGKRTYDGIYLSEQDLYNENLMADTGFRATTSFRDGILETVQFLSSINSTKNF